MRTRSSRPARAVGLSVGLAAGFAADRLLADPAAWHPVAGFGRAARALEGQVYQDSRARGAAYAAVCIVSAGGLGIAAERATRGRPVSAALAAAAATWTVLGAASLRREAAAIGDLLEAGDLDAARERLPRLCGRDPRRLSAGELARAAVESVAENTSDAVVAPLFWGAVAGIPGLLVYRAANTLDAMVGYRSDRYGRFGWAAARLDDVLNYVPARLTGCLTVLLAPRVGGTRREAWRTLRADGGKHPSPNAGRCEAAAAGALGLKLGGTNTYGTRIEHRPPMGNGRGPRGFDVERANRLSAAVSGSAAMLLCGGALVVRFLAAPKPGRARRKASRSSRRARRG
ncbi:MAG TPA: cobalamin biosynthesis protein [Actinocrinis sp.]